MKNSESPEVLRKKRIIKYYIRRAERYDSEPSRCLFQRHPPYEKILSLVDKMTKSLPEKADVLDVGCGTGTLTLKILKNTTNKSFSLHALDFCRNMLLKCRQNIMRKTFGRIHLMQGDVHFLPFRRESMDLIMCHRTLQYLYVDRAITEFKRVLTTEGQMLVTVVTYPDDDVDGFRNSIGCFRKDRYFSHFLSKGSLTKAFLDQGFTINKEICLVVRRYFADLFREKVPFFGKQRIREVTKRFLNAPKKQKQIYGIDEEGFNQFYTILCVHA